MTSDTIKEALKAVKYPGYSRDIVSFGLIKDISAENGAVAVVIELTGGGPEIAQQIKTEAEQVLRGVPEVNHVFVDVKAPQGARPAAAPSQPQGQGQGPERVGGIKQIVAVAVYITGSNAHAGQRFSGLAESQAGCMSSVSETSRLIGLA